MKALFLLLLFTACAHQSEMLETDIPGSIKVSTGANSYTEIRMSPALLYPVNKTDFIRLGALKTNDMGSEVILTAEIRGKRELYHIIFFLDNHQYEFNSLSKTTYKTTGGYKGEKIKHYSLQSFKVSRDFLSSLQSAKEATVLLILDNQVSLKASISETYPNSIKKELSFKSAVLQFTAFLASYSM